MRDRRASRRARRRGGGRGGERGGRTGAPRTRGERAGGTISERARHPLESREDPLPPFPPPTPSRCLAPPRPTRLRPLPSRASPPIPHPSSPVPRSPREARRDAPSASPRPSAAFREVAEIRSTLPRPHLGSRPLPLARSGKPGASSPHADAVAQLPARRARARSCKLRSPPSPPPCPSSSRLASRAAPRGLPSSFLRRSRPSSALPPLAAAISAPPFPPEGPFPPAGLRASPLPPAGRPPPALRPFSASRAGRATARRAGAVRARGRRSLRATSVGRSRRPDGRKIATRIARGAI